MSGETQDSEIRMEVKGLMLDPSSNAPIVILRKADSDVFLPIWIGVFEASAIQLTLEGIEPQRPMTHDLLASTLESLGTEVERVVIHDLRDNTFFAMLCLRRGSERFEVDSRPSDALALALRVKAPIYVHEQVLRKAHTSEGAGASGAPVDEEKLKKWLEELDPDDLGKYTM